MFGQPQDNKPVFGQTASGFGGSFGIGAQTSASQNIFGKPAGFGATTTTANSFGFGSNTMSSSPFSKPFGTSTSQPLFGAGTQQTPAFGTGMFSQQQNTGLFGKPQTSTAFGTGTPSFSFSGQPASQQSSLFSQSKTSTTFPAFGQTNTAAPAFGQQQPSFGQTSNQPSFGTMTFAKPATGFGQPTQPPFGMGMGRYLICFVYKVTFDVVLQVHNKVRCFLNLVGVCLVQPLAPLISLPATPCNPKLL